MVKPGPVSTDFTVLCGGTPQEKTFGALIAREFGLSPQVGRILFNRGIATLEQAQKYLTPRLEELPPPESMKGMREAVACIVSACRKREPLYIHGDYDLDGISATALLVSFFREIGQQALYYIPNRLKEKYGPSIESIDRLLAQDGKRGGGVLITVDCGISAREEVAYAREKGLRVVVTDHHEPPPVLPVADAVVNPKQPGCTFSHATLSGVGIAFFLVVALRKAMGVQMNLKKFLDLVALGTVADVVPLQGVNRLLVRAGLEVLSATHRLGIVSLCEQGGIGGRPNILAEDISFKLAPRINAAGRLGCPSVGVELLLTKSRDEAERIAADLDRMNTKRRQLESEALAHANADCIEQVRAGKAGLAIYQPECHVGVLGIVAARLAEIHHRPVIALTDDGQTAGKGQAVLKGSGRSVKGINLFNILEKCSAAIEQFGGHAMAVGLSVKGENLQLFSSLFDLQIKQNINLFDNAPQRMVDLSLTAATDLTVHLARSLQWMQPFGEGNPEPVLALTGQPLRGMKNRNGHLLFQVQGEGQSFPGIGFHLGELSRHDGRPATLIFQLKQTWFRGAETNQVQALDIIPF